MMKLLDARTALPGLMVLFLFSGPASSPPFSAAAQEPEASGKPPISRAHEGRLLVRGKPLFLLGYFSSGLFDNAHRRAMVDDMVAGGFNALHSVDKNSTPEEYLAFLDYAHEKGIHVLHSVRSRIAQVRRYKSHPAIAAWYLDDVQVIPLKRATSFHAQVRKEDPARAMMYSVGKDIRRYFEIAELGQRQYYPIQPGLEWDEEITRAFEKLVRIVDYCRSTDGRVPQLAVQAQRNRGGAFPTPVQNDLVCYLGIAAGMQGLIWWEFEDDSQPGIQAVKDVRPELYASTKRIAAEVSAMSAVYTEHADSITRKRHSPTVYSATWQGNRESFLVLINVGKEAQEVTVSMPGRARGTLFKVFLHRPGGLIYDPSRKTVSGTVEPESVYVYEIR